MCWDDTLLRVSISSEYPVLLIGDDTKFSLTVAFSKSGRVCWNSGV